MTWRPSRWGRRAKLGLTDLIVALDYVLTQLVLAEVGLDELPVGDLRPLHLDRELAAAARAEVRTVLMRRIRPRGKTVALEAMRWGRPGPRSAQESRARLMFIHEGRFPEPTINDTIRTSDGAFLAEGDLLWRKERVVAEYQSDFHTDRQRRSADSRRSALIHDEGWTLHEVWAEDLRPGPRRFALLRRMALSLGLPEPYVPPPGVPGLPLSTRQREG